jgi:hypothetical protein
MFFVRQNATHKVVVGPAVAVGDGFTPVTTLALGTADEAEVILHDNGTVVDISAYTFAAITTADGYYHLTLQSGITSTVGHVTVVINDDSLILPLRADFTVVEEAVYDALFAAAAPGYLQPTTAARTLDVNANGEAGLDFDNTSGTIDAAQLGADCITEAKIADDAIAAEHIATGAIVAATFAAGAINAAAIANSAINAATFDPDVDAEILSYIVDDATKIDASALNTASGAIGSDGSGLTEAGGTGDHLSAVPRVEADLTYIHGTALTETAGQLAGRFVNFFDQAAATFSVATALADFKATSVTVSDKTGFSLSASGLDAVTLPANLITDVSINASALDGKGDWNTVVPDAAGVAPTATEVVDEWETQALARPTGFRVNVMEVAGTGQTANDNGADINTLITELAKVPKSDGTASWNATALAAIEAEVNDAIDTAISELGVAAPTDTPTIRTGLMLLYMMARNKLVVQTSGTDALEVYNNAGTKICSKLLTDDGSDYTEAEMS